MKLYTIGHSNLSLEDFINLLQKYQITAVADVRSHPYSRYLPHFSKAPLKEELLKRGIKYVFLGKELGARPNNPDCYVEGKAVYDKIAATDDFHAGIQRILIGVKNYTVALMCAEKDPINCHRAILVCQHLRKYELNIFHILKSGNLESHQALEDRLLTTSNLTSNSQQLSLFEEIVNPNLEKLLQKAYYEQGNKIAYQEPKNEQADN